MAVSKGFRTFAGEGSHISLPANMVNQIQISVKVDTWLLEELEKEVGVSGKKRNRIINDAIRLYIRHQDARRADRCCAHDGNQPDRRVIEFMKSMLHERAKVYLDLIDYH